MLILSRYANQSIMIGNDIMISILAIKGSQIRIGIEAPKNIAVHWEEVYEKIQAGKETNKKLYTNYIPQLWGWRGFTMAINHFDIEQVQRKYDNLTPPETQAPPPDSDTIYRKFQPAYGGNKGVIQDSLDNLLVSVIDW